MYDLIVVGGGPAGCAAAITTARYGGKVLLLERGRYPRQKVCGEFLSPESIGVLSSLLLADDRAMLIGAAPRPATMRIFIDGRIISSPLRFAAASVSRYGLDAALWRACEAAGVHTRQNFAASHIQDPHTVVACGETLTARCVVDATGRWSNLRRDHDSVNGTHRFIGLKAHFAEDAPASSIDLYFFPQGYCGVLPVGSGVVNACALVRTDVAMSLEGVFKLEARLAQRTASWKPLMKTVSTFPLVFRDADPVQDSVLCAGDAAGFIDPFVGDGISLALLTGIASAKALVQVWKDGLPLSDAVRAYTAEYKKRFAPVFYRAAWVRRLFSMPLPLRAVAATLAHLPGVSSTLMRLTRAT